ncbi:MAG: tetratricopeptide repeat protein, partial [Candidatus Eiseniibacteriota bacterium]
TIRSWVDDGLLADGNVNEWGLADDLRHVVRSEGELAAAANVLLEHGNAREAVKLNQVNCVLFRESPSAWGRLAKAWSRAGEPAEARDAAERALRLDPDPESIAELLELIDPREEQAED